MGALGQTATEPAILDGSPYQGYLYAYPHKTAYRPLDPPVPLRRAWAGERRDALSGYLHVPFCDQRCGYCNLLTTANPPAHQVRRFLDQVRREALAVRAELEASTEAGPGPGRDRSGSRRRPSGAGPRRTWTPPSWPSC